MISSLSKTNSSPLWPPPSKETKFSAERTSSHNSRTLLDTTPKNQIRTSPSTPPMSSVYVATQVYHALLQNAASARMNAMKNASKNVGEILGKLSLTYNKARQAGITMELVEIISGANAL